MSARRRAFSAIAVGLIALVMPSAPASAAPAAACSDAAGVTVVIDFRELGGGVHVECAGASPSNGLDALAQAGISYQTAIRMPGFLCRIAGKPASDPCVTTSPANAYWTYWIAPRGGSWCYSTLGAGNRTPPPGTVEGWSFAQNKASSALPPPGIAPPRAIPGTMPAPLPASHCATKAPPAPTPTSPPATKAPAVPGAVPSGGSPPSAAGPDGSSSDGSASDPGGGQTAPTTVPAAAGGTATAPAAKAGAATAATEPAATDGPAADSSRAAADDGDEVALEDVDLSSDGRDSGSPLGLLATVFVVAILAGIAFWRRRARAVSGGPA